MAAVLDETGPASIHLRRVIGLNLAIRVTETFVRSILASCVLLIALACVSAQQQPVPQADLPQNNPAPVGTADLSSTLPQLEQAANATALDLAHLRVEKWKGDRPVKEDAASKAESLEKNLTAALPSMISGVRAAPGSLGPGLKLYRNLNAVYDVLTSVAESAGAFGSKDEFRALAADLDSIDSARRALADALENLAAARDAELARLRTQSRPAASEVKKIVIDDNQPAPKPTRKKKAPATPAAPAPKPQ
jgi:predicted RNase H-like HicB family nuclease